MSQGLCVSIKFQNLPLKKYLYFPKPYESLDFSVIRSVTIWGNKFISFKFSFKDSIEDEETNPSYSLNMGRVLKKKCFKMFDLIYFNLCG